MTRPDDSNQGNDRPTNQWASDQPGYPQPPYQQGGYPPGSYYQPGAYQPPAAWGPPRPTNGMAIASMVLGILWVYWVGSILALVFGYLAKRQIDERGESGGGMATAGIVLGWIGVGTLALVIVFWVFAGVGMLGIDAWS